MMKDVMVDLETLDTEADAVILSIGACYFDPIKGHIGEVFDRVVDVDTCLKKNMKISASALNFWLKNPKAAEAVFGDEVSKVSLTKALASFFAFLKYESGDRLGKVRLWANDPSFDKSMITYSARACGVQYPLDFWNTRCVRTVLGFLPPVLFKRWKEDNPRQGYHQASYDAIYQAQYVSYVLRELGCEELF
ncbi:MAG: 3'-5' exoribonuclease [Aureispira sp.]|nr:3'-5' exoribonuclease [Aureispira sp.]